MFRRGPGTYQEAVSFLEDPPADCSIVQIAPPDKLQTGRVTTDSWALAADYALGHALGLRAVESWGAHAGARSCTSTSSSSSASSSQVSA